MPEQLKPTEEFYEIVGTYFGKGPLLLLGTEKREAFFYEIGAYMEDQLNRLKEKEHETTRT